MMDIHIVFARSSGDFVMKPRMVIAYSNVEYANQHAKLAFGNARRIYAEFRQARQAGPAQIEQNKFDPAMLNNADGGGTEYYVKTIAWGDGCVSDALKAEELLHDH